MDGLVHQGMNRTLTATFLSVERLVGSPYVFRKADGTLYGSINMGFRAARARAKLTDVRFHDLRHTFASWLVIAGVSLLVVKELLGHSSFEKHLVAKMEGFGEEWWRKDQSFSE